MSLWGRSQFQYQAHVEPLDTSAPAAPSLPDLSWQPEHPDLVRRGPRLATYALSVAFVVPLGNLALPAPTPWAPTFPAQHLRARQPVREGGAAYVPAEGNWPLLGPTSWEPSYPDQHLRRRPLNPGTGGASYVPAVGNWAVPGLGWIGAQPEQHLRARRRPAGGLTYEPNPDATAAAPDRSWAPSYPDRLARAFDRNRSAGFFAYTPAVGNWTVPGLGWLGTFPDRTLRARRHPFGGTTYEREPGAAVPAPELSWRSTYPDRVPAPRSVLRHLGAFAYVPALGQWALPAPTVWLPFYPERVPGRRRPVNEGGQARGYIGEPIAPPALVDLSWSPSFPARVWARRRPLIPGGVAAWRSIAVSGTDTPTTIAIPNRLRLVTSGLGPEGAVRQLLAYPQGYSGISLDAGQTFYMALRGIRPVMDLELLDDSGTLVDLTGARAWLRLYLPGGATVKFYREMEIISATQARHTWRTTDTDTLGRHPLEVVVLDADGVETTYPGGTPAWLLVSRRSR